MNPLGLLARAMALPLLGLVACSTAGSTTVAPPDAAWVHIPRYDRGEHRFQIKRLNDNLPPTEPNVALPPGVHEFDFEVYQWNAMDLEVDRVYSRASIGTSRGVSVRYTAWRYSLKARLEAGHRYDFDMSAWSPTVEGAPMCLLDLDAATPTRQCTNSFIRPEKRVKPPNGPGPGPG